MGTPELETTLNRAVAGGKKLLVTYLTAGLPSRREFLNLVQLLSEVSDAIEIGVPFSDPVMDGPVLQEASVRALGEGVTPRLALELIARVRAEIDVPLVAMTYYNPVHQIGEREFVHELASSGGAGIIVPDLPLEESDGLRASAEEAGLAHIQLVSPTTSADRAGKLAKISSGFVYAVSRLGVTGEQQTLQEAAYEVVAKVRPQATCPVVLGFGISTPDQAAQAAQIADGVVVASALMRQVLAGEAEAAVALAKEIRSAL